MNIVFASDDNYVPFMGVAIYSLLKSNQNYGKNSYIDQIDIYIMDMGISKENKDKLYMTVSGFNAKVIYINVNETYQFLKKVIKNEVRSLATYCRLFLPSLLPSHISKVIYLDCDILITESLSELWNKDIENYDIAGVLDVISPENKYKIGLDRDAPYVNAGILLINLEKWKKDDREKQMLDFIVKYDGNVCYHDQGTINGVCVDKKIIHPKFNAMTPFFVLNNKQIEKYHSICNYYGNQLIMEARLHPVICHLTPYLTDRPWVKGNIHPLKTLYKEVQKETLWAHVQTENNGKQLRPWLKVAFRFLPNDLFIFLMGLIRKIR